MIRVAHTSDLHIDERGRLEDTVTVLNAFLDQTKEADVDLIVIAGDLFERRSTPTERNVLAVFLQEASRIAPVFIVKGNHDAAEDLTIFAKLDTDAAVIVADRPTVLPGSAPIWGVGIDKKVGLLALPWFDKAHLMAGLDATVDAETSRQMTIAAARDLLVCLRSEAERVRRVGAVPILAGHILVAGSETSTGQTLIGTSVELAPADLIDVGAACVLLGHVHMHQEWAAGLVGYSGSPNRCNFGEPEPKGWRLVMLTDDGEFEAAEFCELPARRMVLIEHDATNEVDLIDLTAATIREGDWPEIDGALVRLRYRIRAQDLHRIDEAAIERQLRDWGAHEVKLEAVVEASTAVRSEEIATTTTTGEKLDAFLRAKNMELNEASRRRLHSRLEELEARL